MRFSVHIDFSEPKAKISVSVKKFKVRFQGFFALHLNFFFLRLNISFDSFLCSVCIENISHEKVF